MSTKTTYYTRIDSPIGPLLLTSDGTALTRLYMKDSDTVEEDWVSADDAAPFAEVRQQLADYFAGKRTEFDLPLAASGTDFQKKVWGELEKIPYGETCSYGDIARRLGDPNASRAVGMANGRNPISIIVPCHRVIGASGKLTGYSGGLSNKEKLLALETGMQANG